MRMQSLSGSFSGGDGGNHLQRCQGLRTARREPRFQEGRARAEDVRMAQDVSHVRQGHIAPATEAVDLFLISNHKSLLQRLLLYIVLYIIFYYFISYAILYILLYFIILY